MTKSKPHFDLLIWDYASGKEKQTYGKRIDAN